MSVEHGQKPPQALETLHRIFTVVRQFGDTDVVRVTPHLYTKPDDVDALARAIRQCAPPR